MLRRVMSAFLGPRAGPDLLDPFLDRLAAGHSQEGALDGQAHAFDNGDGLAVRQRHVDVHKLPGEAPLSIEKKPATGVSHAKARTNLDSPGTIPLGNDAAGALP